MIVYEQAQLCRTAWLALVLCLENGALACLETTSHRRLWLRVPGLLSFNGAVALATLVPGCRPIPNYAPHLHHRCTPFFVQRSVDYANATWYAGWEGEQGWLLS